MSISFSGSELINLAIGIERRGIAFYDIMTKSTENAAASDVFHYLVDMERQHIQIFQVMLSEADKYMWIMTPQILINTVPIIKKRMKNEVEFRIITPKGYKPPSDFQPIKEMNLLEKTLNKVEITIIATDKYSGIALPDLSGKMDYSIGIGGNDLKIRKWIKDLFEFYWDQAISI